jgi:Skp family chaperone for outer membrane proteins
MAKLELICLGNNMAYLKVKGEKNLVRDTNTNAILNVDEIALQAYYKKKEAIRLEKERKQRQEDEINNLQKDVKELKDLVLKLVEIINANKQ